MRFNWFQDNDSCRPILEYWANVHLTDNRPIPAMAIRACSQKRSTTNDMAKRRKHPHYAGYDGANKNLKSLYTSIIKDIEFKETRGEKWFKDGKIADALERFEQDYEELNLNISKDKDAKDRNFTSILSIDNYKDIDINIIKKYIERVSEYEKLGTE